MRKWILAIVIIVIIVAVWYGWSEYNRKHTDLKDQKAVATVTAANLILAFEKDSAAAGKQYNEQVIAVQGTVKKIERENNPVVIFLGDAAQMSSVQASMDSSHAADYKNINTGTAVTIKGRVTGYRTDELFGTDVILNRCVMENKQ